MMDDLTQKLARAEERIRTLNQEKSFLQLIMTLMNKIRLDVGLDRLIENTLQGLLNVIGGTNVSLVYHIGAKIYYADLYGERKQLSKLDDDLVSVAFSSGLPMERELDFQESRMTTAEFSKAYIWAYPLEAGSQVIGVLKIENLHMSMKLMSPHLPMLFRYIASNLKNEIFEQSRLRKTMSDLELEVAARRTIEEELRRSKELLEERVRERTAELMRLEQQFQQTQKLESLGVLAGGIAHDFNNILTIISGHCYMIKMGITLPGGGINDQVDQIEAAADRAAGLCRQMLAYAGKTPLKQTEFPLWRQVEDIVSMLSAALEKNVTISLDLKPDLPPFVGDSSQLQQVIMNLIINAGEAIGEKPGTITVCLKDVTITGEDCAPDYFGALILPGHYIALDVSDTGCGMNEETRARLFEPFFTTKFAGRGLGMSATLGIVKAHNGTLQLTSAEGAGSTFRILFPYPAENSSAPVSAVSSGAAAGVAEGLTILHVDDEEELNVIGSALLKAIGYNVMVAANGREAVELYRNHRDTIALVMLDLVMPEMGGVDTYHELRAMDSTVPVLLCSGYGIEYVSGLIENDRMVDFMRKPYNPVELRRKLSDMLKVRQK